MNLDALKEINANCEERLVASAVDAGSDTEVVKGIALFAAKNGYDALSSNQKYHFNQVIRPLIEAVRCEGYRHEFDETPSHCEATIDDGRLVECYRSDIFYCEACEAQASADAHTKERFFRD